MAGIDEQLRMREMATAGNPQAAQQKYAQSKDLMDLLVAQKVSNDYTSARNAMQAATQTPANPIIDQLDMSNAQVTKNDMMRSLMPGVAIKAGRDQQAMQRQAMGIPSQPAPNIRMADGGIVGYQQGGNVIGYNSRGSVDLLGAALEAEGITDPATINLIRSIYAQESSSGQDAGVSPAGARGGMQVMPATFTEMMGPDADIDDPITNLRAGSRYAQQMLKQADGDPRLAAAAYYGGPDEIAKLRAGNDTTAPQDGFPSVAEYADQIVNRAGSAEREASRKNTNEADVFNLEAAGIDPDFFASTYREGAGQETQPEIAQVMSPEGFSVPINRNARQIGREPRKTVGRSGEELLADAEELYLGAKIGDTPIFSADPAEREARLKTLEQNRTRGTPVPLGDRVPSKDARREQVADPFDVQSMVDRLVAPPFRTQGIIRDAELTNKQKFAKAFNLPLKDFEKPPAPPEKKGIFDNVDIGRLQAFLAGGGGQTNTASALNEGLKGLMGEDQRREALVSKEAIEAAKINSQRYGIEQDYDAAIAKIGAENRRAVFKAQREALEAYKGDNRKLAADALADITNGRDEQFNQNSMRLQETYGSDPEGLTRELIALTNKTLDNRMRSVEGATGGSNSGVFEVELPSGG
jgi:soluble lytic murein transglycosylase-like protein